MPPQARTPYSNPTGYRSGENLARQTQQSAAQNLRDLLGDDGTDQLVRRRRPPRQRQQQPQQPQRRQERHYDYDHFHFIRGPDRGEEGEEKEMDEDIDPHGTDFDFDFDSDEAGPVVTGIACGPGIDGRPYRVVRRHPHPHPQVHPHPHPHPILPPEILIRAAEDAVDPAAVVITEEDAGMYDNVPVVRRDRERERRRERERERRLQRERHETRLRRLGLSGLCRCPMCRGEDEQDQGDGGRDGRDSGGKGGDAGKGGGGDGANRGRGRGRGRGRRREDSDDERLIPQIGDYGESDGESYVRERAYVLPRWATYG